MGDRLHRHSANALVIAHYRSLLRGLFAESDDCSLIVQNTITRLKIYNRLNYTDQIPHKAACKFHHYTIHCWRQLRNDGAACFTEYAHIY